MTCITPLPILRRPRRFCRNPSPGGASDSSTVREHWERRERQASPGTGRKNRRRVLLSPRSGAGKFAIRTQGSRPGLFSFALRASGTFLVAALPLRGADAPVRAHPLIAFLPPQLITPL